MNIQQYKQNLGQLSNALKKFDSNKADNDVTTLNEMFKIVYKSGILDITHFEKKEQDFYKLELFTTLTEYSGSLAFLVIQNLAAHNIMAKNNYPNKEFYFNKKCGIAINHLRAPITLVDSIKVDGGYLLNGTLTWASGYEIFDTLLIGFHHVGEEKEVVSPFKINDGFIIKPAEETFVGFGLNTVNISLNNYFVKDEKIVSTKKIGNYTKNKSASKTVHFCIYGLGINATKNIKDKDLSTFAQKKIHTIKEQFMSSNDTKELDTLRIELFTLVLTTITTGMILNGGSSVLHEKPLQRFYRELMMFNSNGLNNTLKSIFKENYLRGYNVYNNFL